MLITHKTTDRSVKWSELRFVARLGALWRTVCGLPGLRVTWRRWNSIPAPLSHGVALSALARNDEAEAPVGSHMHVPASFAIRPARRIIVQTRAAP